MQFLVEYMNAVLDGETGELLEYRQLIQRPKYKDVWSKSFANEIGRLAQDIGGRADATNTIILSQNAKCHQIASRMLPTAELFAIIAIKKLKNIAQD